MTDHADSEASIEALAPLLASLRAGNEDAFDRLIPLVYQELKVVARHHLRTEALGHTLQTTALVNEAYLKLSRERRIPARSRVEFFGVASHAMRRVLVDYARKRKSAKRGGGAEHIPLETAEAFLGEKEADEILALDRAIERLEKMSPRAATIVAHRYFSGLTIQETANLLGLSTKTIDREWSAARAWLQSDVTRQMGIRKGLQEGL